MKVYIYREDDGHVVFQTETFEDFLQLRDSLDFSFQVPSQFVEGNTQSTKNKQGQTPTVRENSPNRIYFWSFFAKSNGAFGIECGTQSNIIVLLNFLQIVKSSHALGQYSMAYGSASEKLFFHSVQPGVNTRLTFPLGTEEKPLLKFIQQSNFCVEIDTQSNTWKEIALPDFVSHDEEEKEASLSTLVEEQQAILPEIVKQELPSPTSKGSNIKFNVLKENEAYTLQVVFANEQLCTLWNTAYQRQASKLGCLEQLSLKQEKHCLTFPAALGARSCGISAVALLFESIPTLDMNCNIRLPHTKLMNFFKDSFGIKIHYLDKSFANKAENITFKKSYLPINKESTREDWFELDIDYIEETARKGAETQLLKP